MLYIYFAFTFRLCRAGWAHFLLWHLLGFSPTISGYIHFPTRAPGANKRESLGDVQTFILFHVKNGRGFTHGTCSPNRLHDHCLLDGRLKTPCFELFSDTNCFALGCFSLPRFGVRTRRTCHGPQGSHHSCFGHYAYLYACRWVLRPKSACVHLVDQVHFADLLCFQTSAGHPVLLE